jgi:uncharacterized membrane protein YqjE
MAHVTSTRDTTNGDGLPRVPSIPLSDEAAFDAARNQSIGHLVKDATTHLSTLVRAEIELAKTELGRELKKALVGSVFFIVALVVALYSSFFFFFFLADVLDIWLDRWVASGIVFGLMIVVAALAALIGYRRVRRIQAPERTISNLKDTAAVLTHRGDDGETGTQISTETAGTAPRPT